jgi:predicted ester cyclase
MAEIRARYAAVHDFFTTIAELIVDTEASAVAIRWTAVGTHRGPFFGGAATGHRIRFAEIETLRIHDGLLVERAGEWDDHSLLRQFGVLPG